MKSLNELKNMKKSELEAELLDLRKEQFNQRLTKANGALEKTHLLGQVKKTIARVKTIMTEKAGE